jgi:hypothetical protein
MPKFPEGKEAEQALNLVLVKQFGVISLVGVNLFLLGLAVAAYRQKRPLPATYYKLLPVSPAIAAFQIAMGLFFLSKGFQVHGMHLFYGIVVGTGAALQVLLRPTTATGQRYKARPLVHAVLALAVSLVAIRSWMSA